MTNTDSPGRCFAQLDTKVNPPIVCMLTHGHAGAHAGDEGTHWTNLKDVNYKLGDDAVNHPSHYTAGEIECWQAIKAALSPEEWRGFLKGTILRYIWREKHKNGAEDIRKADWYAQKLKECE